MSSTKAHIWPQGVQADVQHLINLYFALVDSKDPGAGPRLADEVFARDGKWFAAAGCFEGHGTVPPPWSLVFGLWSLVLEHSSLQEAVAWEAIC